MIYQLEQRHPKLPQVFKWSSDAFIVQLKKKNKISCKYFLINTEFDIFNTIIIIKKKKQGF